MTEKLWRGEDGMLIEKNEEEFLFDLRAGYWERTAVCRTAAGQEVVRKVLQGGETAAPWAKTALREEIAYLQSLRDPARSWFPALLESWDSGDDVGYARPYLRNARDAGGLVLDGALEQEEAYLLQKAVADAVFRDLHSERCEPASPFRSHWEDTMVECVNVLSAVEELGDLVEADGLNLQGARCRGLRSAMSAILELGLPERFDAEPCVRLHGDLILENILWDREGPEGPRLWLIDPVSVAGVWRGPPVFDLVKYESYASGTLYALRAGLFDAEKAGKLGREWRFAVDWETAALRAFRNVDLCKVVRDAYVQRYGEPSATLAELLDAYFSLVMARNTKGRARLGRVLHAVQALNRALTLER